MQITLSYQQAYAFRKALPASQQGAADRRENVWRDAECGRTVFILANVATIRAYPGCPNYLTKEI